MPFIQGSGPMQSQGFAVAQGNSGSALSRVDPILALTSKREQYDARDSMPQSFRSKSEVFAERSIYLETFFEGALFATPNTFMTQKIFPHRRYDDVNFRWRYVNFPSQPAVRTAQQAPPEKMAFEQSWGQATMSRYALAVEGLDEDQRSTSGKAFLAGMIGAMSHGFHSMFELNGFRAIEREAMIIAKYFFEAQLFGIDLSSKLGIELAHFDIMRTKFGFQTLTNDVQNEGRQTQSIIFTHAIIGEGARSIFSQGDEMRHYNLRGDGNKAFSDLQASAPELRNRFAGVELLVARSYYFDGAGIKINPLERHIIIGSFSIYDDFRPDLTSGHYRARMSEASVYSVDDGRMVWMSTAWLVCNSSRFDADGNLTTQHLSLAKKGLTIAAVKNLPTPDNRIDMFIYALPAPNNTVQFEVASHWGHMERWALMDHVVRGIGSVAAARIEEKIGVVAAHSVRAGLSTIDHIRRKVLEDVDETFMRLAAPATDARGNAIGRYAQSAGNEYGAHNLPTQAAFLGAIPDTPGVGGGADIPATVEDIVGYVPAGYGTFGGLMTIGTQASTSTQKFGYIAESVRKTAAQFVPAVEALMQANEEIYHAADPKNPTRVQRTHPALLEEHAPSFYRSSAQGERGRALNALLSFGYNMLTGVHLPVYLSNLGGGGGGVVNLGATVEDLSGADNIAFATISATLREGAPQAVINAFGSNAKFGAFADRFNTSALGDAYRRYLAGGGDSATVVRTRRTDRAAGPLPFLAGEDAIDVDDAFRRFVYREIIAPGGNTASQVSVMARAVFYVDNGQAPTVLTAEMLEGWRVGSAIAIDANQTIATGVRDASLYLTRLSVPFERLRASMKLASPLNSGQQLDDAAPGRLDAALNNVALDLTATVIFSGAHAHGGLRRPAVATTRARRTPSAMFGVSTAPPTMTGSVFTDTIVGGAGTTRATWRRTNKNIETRWKESGALTNVMERVARRMFLLAPITRAVAISLPANNIKLPFAHIVARPNKRYKTEAVIYLSIPPGRPIGFTATHDPRVNYVHNGATETFFIHMVLYTETVITHGNRIMIVPDARVTGYMGGDGIAPFTPENYVAEDLRKMPEKKGDVQSPSMLVFMQPAGSLFGSRRHIGRAYGDDLYGNAAGLFGQVFDIRGYWGRVKGGNLAGRASRASITGARGSVFAHYHSALYYNYIFPFDHLKVPSKMRECKLKNTSNFDNTVCLQEEQHLCTNGGGVANAKIEGCDHLANSIGKNCGAKRRGYDNGAYDSPGSTIPLPAIAGA